MRTVHIVLSKKIDQLYHQQLITIINYVKDRPVHLLVRESLDSYNLFENVTEKYDLEAKVEQLNKEKMVQRIVEAKGIVIEMCNTECEREMKSLVICVKGKDGKLPEIIILDAINFLTPAQKAIENVYILSTTISEIMGVGTPLHLKNLIDKVNDITRTLNTNYKNVSLRKRRLTLMKSLLPYVDKTVQYFVMPFIFPEFKVSANIALVGNSKKLLRKEYGKEIDAHMNVFRFNYAVTKGFEKFAGKKADIRVGNIQCLQGNAYSKHPKGLVQNYRMYRSLPEKRYIIFSGKGLLGSAKIAKMARKNKINLKVKRIHNVWWNARYFRSIRDDLHLPACSKKPQCGTGFVLLLTELGIVPDLYGFDMSIGGDNLGYYWSGNVVHTQRSHHHNISQEHEILKTLSSKNYINIM